MSEGKGGFLSAVEGVSRAVDRVVGALCAALFGSMTVVVIIGVFFRYVLNAPLSWPEEVSRYLMIWGASIGITLGIRAEEHVGLTVLLDAVKSRAVRNALRTVIFLLVLAFLAVLLKYSIAMTRDGKFMQTQSLDISMQAAFAALPVASALAVVQLALMYVIRLFRVDEKPRDMTIIDI